MSFPDTQIKGSILVGSSVAGAASMTPIPVGPDGQVLTADSAQPTGVKWAPAGAGTDVYAATRVVSLISGDGTDLTIAAAIAALPPAGGYIYIKQGTYPIAATLMMPDKPVVIKGSGDGTIISLGANAIPAFTIPNGLTARREYAFESFLVTGTSVANQKVWSIEDQNSRGIVHAQRINSSGVQFPVHITSGGVSALGEPVTVTLDDCHFIPLAAGTGILINTPALAGVSANVYMQRVRFYDVFQDAVTGALTAGGIFADFTGINVLGEDCVFSIGTSGTVGAISLFDCVLFNFAPTANATIAVADDNFGSIPSCMVGCGGAFVNFSFAGQGTHVYGGFYEACSFTDGAISFFTDVNFFTDLTVETAVIIGAGATFVMGCFFDNQGTDFVLDGNFNTISGNRFQTAGVGLTAIIRTTDGSAAISDNRFPNTTVPPILEAGTISTNNIDNNRWNTAPVLLAVSDAVVNGNRLFTTSGNTADAPVTQFTTTNQRGLTGVGTVKNTGANSMDVLETVTDAFGTTSTKTTPVGSGNSLLLEAQVNLNAAVPPYVSYSVAVQSTVAGQATSFDLRYTSEGADA